ncbi:MAG: hypothetical protein JNM69_42960 [Archangium sp.]|nr:hypothetical protein [Archangium sp.]
MRTRVSALAGVLGVLVSCGTPQTCATCVDAGASAGGSGEPAVDAGVVDAGCSGECATTDLLLRFGTRMAALERAQHGVQTDGRLYVEAHSGGDPACPSMTSPTPLRTLAIANLRVLPDGGAVTFADGLRVSLFDFGGAVTSAPLERAVDARAVARWLEPGVLISFRLTATFDGGTLTGGFVAPHCTSLDD